MTAAERIYELVNALPAEQVSEILDFAEFLYQKQATQSQSNSSAPIPPGTLTRLRGIAKKAAQTLSNEELQDNYANYLAQKYQ